MTHQFATAIRRYQSAVAAGLTGSAANVARVKFVTANLLNSVASRL
jgi:hypothetical protein